MKTQTASKYGKPSIGSYLDQANRNSTDHDVATIELAMSLGFVPDAEMVKLMARADNDVLSEERDDAQMLSESADEAIEWLNEQETRPFLYWANYGDAGAFGLWPNVEGAKEDCGFVSSRKQEFPPEGDDYSGEWLHINDHGNCTLYVRELREGNGYFDREVWSVV